MSRSPTGQARSLEQRTRWLAAAQAMRIDPPTPGLYVIIDYVARRMSVVREADRSVIEMAAPEGMAGPTGASGAAHLHPAGRGCGGGHGLHGLGDDGSQWPAGAGLHHCGRRAAARQRRRAGFGERGLGALRAAGPGFVPRAGGYVHRTAGDAR